MALLEIETDRDRRNEIEKERWFNTFVEYYCVCGSNVFVVLKIRFENWIRFTLIYHPSKAFVPKMLIHSILKIASCQIRKFATAPPHTAHTHHTTPLIYTTLVRYYVIFANEARLM